MYPTAPLYESLARLQSRRSVKAMHLQEPAPSNTDLEQILQTAIRVPDHGKLGPWRFIRFTGQSRAAFGELLAQRYGELNPDASAQNKTFERNRLLRAPAVIAVIAHIKAPHKIPQWEQQLSVGAACQNMLVAACLLGYGAQWLTEWYAYDHVIDQALGLADNERVAGYIYIGAAETQPPERARPKLEDVLSDWQLP